MSTYAVPVWKEAPFVRLLPPLIIGILVQCYIGLPAIAYGITFLICTILLLLFSKASLFTRFRHSGITGLATTLLLLNLGGMAAWCTDIRHHARYYDPGLHSPAACIVSITAPLTEKPAFLKAAASVDYTFNRSVFTKAEGNVIIYFQKDTASGKINGHSRIAFSKPLQAIAGNGNPGAFDYRRYCALQNIYYQVYLKKGDYVLLSPSGGNSVNDFLNRVKQKVTGSLTRYIPGKKEAGMAEALLIGYKDDLDKALVQSYSNTGVVHIIAISGMHLGLIYGLLSLVCYPLNRYRYTRYLKPLVIICGLWLFAIIAGASASVLRSAVMFSFIVAGETFKRRTSIYNSLAGSAFLLLCYNPYWLWDAGFQLSYLAVLGIVIFMRPVYGWCFVQNKLLDGIWKGCAISIAAQIFTTPVSIGLFHQFPNYFLITNVVAVPLSGLIVLGEIALCIFSPLPLLAKAIGWVVYRLIWLMNVFIAHMEHLPFSVMGGLQLSVAQVLVLYIVICAAGAWLMKKQNHALITGMCACCCFWILRFAAAMEVAKQQKLIVYNVPRHQAVDIIGGRYYYFMGDSMLQSSTVLQSAYLAPSRILFQVKPVLLPAMDMRRQHSMVIGGRRILFISGPIATQEGMAVQADCVVLSGNPGIRISELVHAVNCTLLVLDSSNPLWKVNKWKAECRQYNIRCYAVAEKGAFILPLN